MIPGPDESRSKKVYFEQVLLRMRDAGPFRKVLFKANCELILFCIHVKIPAQTVNI